MTGKRQSFFGTPTDFRKVFVEIEGKHKLVYVRTGRFEVENIEPLPTMLNPRLGLAESDNAILCATYLVVKEKARLQATKIPTSRECDISLDANPEAVMIHPGGIFEEGILVGGELVRISDYRVAVELFKIFQSALRKHFSKINGHFVGKEAEEFFDSGWRLCWCASAGKEYDLQRIQPDASAPRRPRKNRSDRTKPSPKLIGTQSRCSYQESCQFLMKNGWEFGCDFLVDRGWNGQGEPPNPRRMPKPDDKKPCGVSFFRTGVCGEPDEPGKLENLTLPRTFICRSEVSNISFTNTALNESFMCWNQFLNVDFSRADLSNADLRASLFKTAKFDTANLANADFRHAKFEDCDFNGAKMNGCRLSAKLEQELKLTQEQISVIDWSHYEGELPPGG